MDEPGLERLLRTRVRDIPDHPLPGIVFRDITPLLADAQTFIGTVDALTAWSRPLNPEKVVGVEARGFILAAPVAHQLGTGFVPVRKHGRLPHETLRESYELEYASAAIEVHVDAVAPGERVLVVDDVLATGGTAAATAELLQRAGAEVVGFAFLIELLGLAGRGRLGAVPTLALLTY